MKKRMILALLTIALVAVSILVAEAFATEPVQVPERIDLCLTEELTQAQAVLERFPIDGTDRVYENPQEIGAPFIPEGAWCMDICTIGEVVSIDYRLDGVRYIVSYRKDGVVGITASLWTDPVEEVYSVYSDTGEVEVYHVADHTEVWTSPGVELDPEATTEFWHYSSDKGYYR